MTRAMMGSVLAAIAVGACGGDGGDQSRLGEDTTATAVRQMQAPAGGAVELGEPLLVSAFRQAAADTADAVTGMLRLYADAGPGDPMAAKDKPTKEDSLMDTGADRDPGTALETPGVESPAAGSGGGFRISVTLDGLTPGGHAWHIHSGPCGQQAPVVVPFTKTADHKGIAHPLNADAAGTARALVTVPPNQLTLQQVRQGQYSVHVHLNPGIDHGPTVACANLRQEDGVEGA